MFALSYNYTDPVVKIPPGGMRYVSWQFFPDQADSEFARSVRNCRLTYSGDGGDAIPVRLSAEERGLRMSSSRQDLWFFLDPETYTVHMDFALTCETPNGEETIERKMEIDFSHIADRFAKLNRIRVIPARKIFNLPYRRGQRIRFEWDLRLSDDPAINQRMPCKLVLDYPPYANTIPLIPFPEMIEALKDLPDTVFLDLEHDDLFDITETRGSLEINLRDAARVFLACKGYTSDRFNSRQFAMLPVYGSPDPYTGNNNDYSYDTFLEKYIAPNIDLEAFFNADATALADAGSCREYRTLAGATQDGWYPIQLNDGRRQDVLCVQSLPGYEGFMLVARRAPEGLPDYGDRGYDLYDPYRGGNGQFTWSFDIRPALHPEAVGSERGVYVPATGEIFVYDAANDPDGSKADYYQRFVIDHLAQGHVVTEWVR